MKSIFSFLILLVGLFTFNPTSAQDIPTTLTADMIGLPDEVYDDIRNAVFTTKKFQGIRLLPVTTKKVVKGVTTKSTSKKTVINPVKIEAFGVYASNMVHNYIYEFDYEYIGRDDTSYIFRKEPLTFPVDPDSYENPIATIDGQTAYLSFANGQWRFVTVPDNPGYYDRKIVNGKLREIFYNADSLIKYGAKNAAQIRNACMTHWIGSNRNPQTHVTSLFPVIYRTGEFTATCAYYVSGSLVDNTKFPSMITSYDKPAGGYKQRWILYNGCIPDPTLSLAQSNPFSAASYSYGNSGECWQRTRPSSDVTGTSINLIASDHFEYDEASNTLTYDASKPAILQAIRPQSSDNGKVEQGEATYNLRTDQQLQRLPRGNE